MSEVKNPLEAMLAQYENNNKPKYTKSDTAKVYDLKNYFNTFIEKGLNKATKEIRILPTTDGSSPLVEFYGHKVKIDGETKTFPCLEKERKEPCPFCEAREALLATGEATDKELAKKYSPRLMYIVKVIDRFNEADGVKFWRFNHDYRKEGVFDKISGAMAALKKDRDITNAVNGRDLVITVNRNQNEIPIVSAIAASDVSPLSENQDQINEWLSDTRTWEDVYSVRPYSYLEIVVKGGVPVWDKEEKKFVDKASLIDEADSKLEDELTMGVENVKADIKAASTKKVEPIKAEAPADDDLPF